MFSEKNINLKKALCKSTIVIPVVMATKIIDNVVSLNILEINLFLRTATVISLYILFFMWFALNPIRKDCANGAMMEVIYNLVPSSLLGLLLFAQYHFYIAVILSGIIIIFLTLTILKYYACKRRRCYSGKRLRLLKKTMMRKCVFGFVAICFIPEIISIIGYEMSSPIYTSKIQMEKKFPDTVVNGLKKEAETDLYRENIELLLKMQKSEFKKYSIQEKVDLMKAFADFECKVLGIPELSLTVEALGYGELGVYKSEEKKISFDLEYINGKDDWLSSDDVGETICHECFHAFQEYITQEVVYWDNPVTETIFFDEVKEWAINMNEYKDSYSYDFETYKNQPIEKSANEYGKNEMKRIRSYIREYQKKG